MQYRYAILTPDCAAGLASELVDVSSQPFTTTFPMLQLQLHMHMHMNSQSFLDISPDDPQFLVLR